MLKNFICCHFHLINFFIICFIHFCDVSQPERKCLPQNFNEKICYDNFSTYGYAFKYDREILNSTAKEPNLFLVKDTEEHVLLTQVIEGKVIPFMEDIGFEIMYRDTDISFLQTTIHSINENKEFQQKEHDRSSEIPCAQHSTIVSSEEKVFEHVCETAIVVAGFIVFVLRILTLMYATYYLYSEFVSLKLDAKKKKRKTRKTMLLNCFCYVFEKLDDGTRAGIACLSHLIDQMEENDQLLFIARTWLEASEIKGRSFNSKLVPFRMQLSEDED